VAWLTRKPIGWVLLAAVILLSSCLPARGHSGDVLSGWAAAAPVIDGTIGAAEWSGASKKTFTLGGWTCTVYEMNDANNLYMALEIPDTTHDVNDMLLVYFDNDNDGVTEVGNDLVGMSSTSPGFFGDYYCSALPNTWSSDVGDGGTNDGSGVLGFSGGVHYYEFSHPLDTTDNAHDFSLSAGSTVGFMIGYLDNLVSVGGWPGTLFPPQSWGDIIIASPPAPVPAVGGVIVSVDKLVLLAPYFVAILVIAAAGIVIKRRRH